MTKKYLIPILLLFILFPYNFTFAQSVEKNEVIDYSKPKEYTIAGISVSGVQFIDNNMLIMFSGLAVGEKIMIPGDKITGAITKLWKQGMFEDIEISVAKIEGDNIFLKMQLTEQPKLSKFSFNGIKKTEADDLREEMGIVRGDVVNKNTINKITTKVEKYFIDKGYLNVATTVKKVVDTTGANDVILYININKGSKVKIQEIVLNGNSSYERGVVLMQLKNTKQKAFYRVWKASKYVEKDYRDDLTKVIDYYYSNGYRDARIVSDSLVKINEKYIKLYIDLHEGSKYYFGNITWVGNTKYSSNALNAVLGIKKGEVYNQKHFETRLFMDMEAGDVHSLYMNDGYLFSSITPVETNIHNDTIDLEVRIYEGKQARVKHVTVSGNSKTHDNVIFREIRTKPGELFNRAEIIRTQRELAQLQYFDQNKLGVNPKPNPVDGTVDIEYVVEETSSDQIEMSLGWGLGTLVGTVGVSFNNFSTKNFFNSKSWKPVPSGDGQKLSLRVQSNGIYYQGYNVSFTEPWLGGKKPNSLTVSAYYSLQTNGLAKTDVGRTAVGITGVSVGLGRRLKWPDDYFTIYYSLGLQNYNLNNSTIFEDFRNGNSRNLTLTLALSRNSIDRPIYPTSGSDIGLTVQLTPPYSIFNDKDYSALSNQEKYLWLEYYKWKLNFAWFTGVGKSEFGQKLVLHTRAKFGFLGSYNPELEGQPFERFWLGGDGLSGYSLDGRELIGMRGYANNSLTPKKNGSYVGGSVFTKYTLELRYPISTNPMATIFVMGFLEAGNTYSTIKDFNPFNIYRSAGVGARVYLPMFGLLGLDWGYGFDKIPGDWGSSGGQFHFSINGSID